MGKSWDLWLGGLFKMLYRQCRSIDQCQCSMQLQSVVCAGVLIIIYRLHIIYIEYLLLLDF